MNKFTQTIKSTIAGTVFAAFAMVSTSASADISIGDGYVTVNTWSQVQAFCANSFITCTDVKYYRGGYMITYSG